MLQKGAIPGVRCLGFMIPSGDVTDIADAQLPVGFTSWGKKTGIVALPSCTSIACNVVHKASTRQAACTLLTGFSSAIF